MVLPSIVARGCADARPDPVGALCECVVFRRPDPAQRSSAVGSCKTCHRCCHGKLGMLDSVSGFLSHLSFWFFFVGVVLLLMRGMGPPGSRSVDKKKFAEVRSQIDSELTVSGAPMRKKILLYVGKYFFSYFYYRADLIFIFFFGGGLVLKFISELVR